MTAQEAKRAFVTVLLALAAVYGLVLNINRDSVDTELVSAFKRVARKANPDKGAFQGGKYFETSHCPDESSVGSELRSIPPAPLES